jgi:hypothetical protein
MISRLELSIGATVIEEMHKKQPVVSLIDPPTEYKYAVLLKEILLHYEETHPVTLDTTIWQLDKEPDEEVNRVSFRLSPEASNYSLSLATEWMYHIVSFLHYLEGAPHVSTRRDQSP